MGEPKSPDGTTGSPSRLVLGAALRASGSKGAELEEVSLFWGATVYGLLSILGGVKILA